MNMRKLASIQRIAEIKAIEGADRIVAYRVQGWWVVGQKDEYKVDDLCIYCEVDSWIPTELAPFLSKGKDPREFNGVKGEKLRTIKLKGQLSQGLLLPVTIRYTKEKDKLSVLKGSGPVTDLIDDILFTLGREKGLEEIQGFDVTELLGIQKWEMPMNAQLAGMARGNFPSFIRKTDQERIQNLSKELKDWNEKPRLTWEITEKLEGSSMTVYFNEGEFGVCSRNLNLKETEGNSFWQVARELGLEEKMRAAGANMALQGELIGPGVQGNIYKLSKLEFRLFDVWDIGLQEYYQTHDRYMVERTLGLEHAPVLDTAGKIDHMSMDDILFYAEGKSKLFDTEREGVVFKCNQYPNISFKAISNAYLLTSTN